MNEYTISLNTKELEYLLNSIKYDLYNSVKCLKKVDDNKIFEVFNDKSKLSSVLPKEDIEYLKRFDYFKKLNLYLKLRKKLLGF